MGSNNKLHLELHMIGRAYRVNNNRSRYSFVQTQDAGPYALYDIVDNLAGAEQVLAYRVRREPALDIVGALNEREEAKRVQRMKGSSA